MTATPDKSDPSAGGARSSNAVPWKSRSDLIIRTQDSGSWIVKDPLSLSYSLLREQEMAVLRLLNGRRSVDSILEHLRQAWPDIALRPHDLEELIGQLIHSQLLVPCASAHRSSRPEATSRKLPAATLFQISSLLRMQFRLFDPTVILVKLHPWIMRLFSRKSAACLALLLITAIAMLALRFEQFAGNLPGPLDFFGPDNLLLLLTAFVIVKTLHEVGHALAAARYGAECHEAGVMMLFFTPLLYTNVTDAWILDRRSRLMITAAGMLVEVALASMATVLWFFAAPGLLKAMLANVIVLCTVGTVLFNGNPLLRYDGYFLLTDAIGIPNLAQRASSRVQRFLEDLLLGRRTDEPETGSPFLLVYGLVSSVYRVSLTFAILVMLYGYFDQWDLRIPGAILMIAAAISMVAAPCVSFVGRMIAVVYGRRDRGARSLRAISLMCLAAAGLFIPLPRSLVIPAVVEPSGLPIFTTLSGELVSCLKYGDFLSPGDAVASLDDLRLRRQLTELKGEVSVHETRIRGMELNRPSTAASQLPEAKNLLATAQKRLEQFKAEIKRLKAESPTHGVLLPPRAKPANADPQVLPEWAGFPLDAANIGAHVVEGTLLGYVCDPQEVQLLLTLSNDERQLIHPGQLADFQLQGNPDLVLRGIVERVASLEVRELPEELTAAGLAPPLSVAGPDVDTRRWQAVIKTIIPSVGFRPPLYATGVTRVSIDSTSLANRVIAFLSDTFEL